MSTTLRMAEVQMLSIFWQSEGGKGGKMGLVWDAVEIRIRTESPVYYTSECRAASLVGPWRNPSRLLGHCTAARCN